MKIEKGKVKKPFIIMVHGTQGVGKSTLSNDFESNIFVGTENTDELDANRAEKLTSIKMLDEQLDWLLNSDHKFKTLSVDAIDGIEQLAIQEIINSDSKCKNPSLNRVHGGYGAGTGMLVKGMLDLRDKLQLLRDQKGMNIVILCHTKTKTTTDPVAGATYDEFKLALSDQTENIWLDWVSATLFMTDIVEKSDDEKFAFGKGEKVIYTQRRPGSVAKNRFNLPYEIDAPVDNPSGPFMKYFNRFFSGDERSAKEIKTNIDGLMKNLSDPELVKTIEKTVKAAKTVEKLVSIEKRIIERVG